MNVATIDAAGLTAQETFRPKTPEGSLTLAKFQQHRTLLRELIDGWVTIWGVTAEYHEHITMEPYRTSAKRLKLDLGVNITCADRGIWYLDTQTILRQIASSSNGAGGWVMSPKAKWGLFQTISRLNVTMLSRSLK